VEERGDRDSGKLGEGAESREGAAEAKRSDVEGSGEGIKRVGGEAYSEQVRQERGSALFGVRECSGSLE
jgi:hypothetical protein